MNVHLYCYCILFFLTYIFIKDVDSITCNSMVSPCICNTDQGTVDLSPLDSGSDKTAGLSSHKPNDWVYDYNPCTPLNLGSGTGGTACNGVLGCQKNEDETQFVPLGDSSSAQWVNDDSGNLQISMKSQDSSGTTRTMVISLICDCEKDKDFIGNGGDPNLVYSFTLTSRYSCPGSCSGGGSLSLSIGSILLIILAVALLVYVIGGVLFLHFAKGANGQEMIPNVTLWKTIPGLVKDGVIFVISIIKGKSKGTYEQI